MLHCSVLRHDSSNLWTSLYHHRLDVHHHNNVPEEFEIASDDTGSFFPIPPVSVETLWPGT